MLMPVMQVGPVFVGVRQSLVPMKMRVGFTHRVIRPVLMLMMCIMAMPMRMLQMFMFMLMEMALR